MSLLASVLSLALHAATGGQSFAGINPQQAAMSVEPLQIQNKAIQYIEKLCSNTSQQYGIVTGKDAQYLEGQCANGERFRVQWNPVTKSWSNAP